MRCGRLIDGDNRFCPECGSRSPFGYHCPTCLKSIQKGGSHCPGCGRALDTACPGCGRPTFIGGDVCESCGAPLLVQCGNARCGEMQFFENQKCTACGKKISKRG
jgi:predicted amidophosphoribosyltransferase